MADIFSLAPVVTRIQKENLAAPQVLKWSLAEWI
jgi:hypothetical protein